MIPDDVVRKVLAEALGRGGDWSELFIEDRSSTVLQLEDSKVEGVSSGHDRGAGVRVVAGERASYAYTNLLTEAALLETARAARAGLDAEAGTVTDLREVNGSVHSVRVRPETVDTADKVDALHAADDAARSFGEEIRQVACTYMEVRQQLLIANSLGTSARDDRTRVRLACKVVATRGDVISTGFSAPGHTGGFELLEHFPAAEIGSKAGEKAITMLGARPSPAGEFPVVLGSGHGGVLIHEACGHGLEADTLAKNASVYAGRQGERFGSEIVTIVDDGSAPGRFGSFGVDDEGTPAQRTVLFDQGVLVGHISDRRSATRLGAAPTGNGRRQNYTDLPIVRMTNTYLLPGPDDASEIVRSVSNGVFAASFAGGEVNPATGNFVFGMNEAYMIIDGELAYPIRGATLSGNGPDVLARIEAVAADFDHKEAVCGKDGQSAPVTHGVPTVLLSHMTVGGTEA